MAKKIGSRLDRVLVRVLVIALICYKGASVNKCVAEHEDEDEAVAVFLKIIILFSERFFVMLEQSKIDQNYNRLYSIE